jgi:hypothetical protein
MIVPAAVLRFCRYRRIQFDRDLEDLLLIMGGRRACRITRGTRSSTENSGPPKINYINWLKHDEIGNYNCNEQYSDIDSL